MAGHWIGGILVFLFGVTSMLLSLRLRGTTAEELGAGFFPFWVSVGICGLAAANLCFMWLQKKGSLGVIQWPQRSGWFRIGITFTLFIGYFLALPRFGFIPSTFAMVAAFTKLVFDRSWLSSLLLSAAVALIVYGLLSWLLGVRLPVGRLGGPWAF